MEPNLMILNRPTKGAEQVSVGGKFPRASCLATEENIGC